MQINKKLNLVSTLIRDSGEVVYFHAMPLPYEVVEEHCVVLGNLFSNFMGLVGTIGAPRVAAMMLRKRIESDRRDGIIADGEPTLIDAIQRTTTVIYLGDDGWKSTPLTVALKQGLIDADEFREVEGEIVFFTVSCAMQRANLIPGTVGRVLALYAAQLTSSSISEYRDSLTTSKVEESTSEPLALPEKPEASFIPS